MKIHCLWTDSVLTDKSPNYNTKTIFVHNTFIKGLVDATLSRPAFVRLIVFVTLLLASAFLLLQRMLEQAKEEWELNHLQAMKEEEERRKTATQ